MDRAMPSPDKAGRMTSVLLVDDQELIRAGLRSLLDGSEGIVVVGEADNGRRALELVRSLRPDVVLMDLKMPVMPGIEATRAIRQDPLVADTPVLILTTFDDERDVLDAIHAGATGYVLKDCDPAQLRRLIHGASQGDVALAPAVAKQLMTRIANSATDVRPDPRLETLTSRELEVLTEVAKGHSNDEIAKMLFISPHTSRTYVSRLLAKLDARDRSQLVVMAYRSGLIAREP